VEKAKQLRYTSEAIEEAKIKHKLEQLEKGTLKKPIPESIARKHASSERLEEFDAKVDSDIKPLIAKLEQEPDFLGTYRRLKTKLKQFKQIMPDIEGEVEEVYKWFSSIQTKLESKRKDKDLKKALPIEDVIMFVQKADEKAIDRFKEPKEMLASLKEIK